MVYNGIYQHVLINAIYNVKYIKIYFQIWHIKYPDK